MDRKVVASLLFYILFSAWPLESSADCKFTNPQQQQSCLKAQQQAQQAAAAQRQQQQQAQQRAQEQARQQQLQQQQAQQRAQEQARQQQLQQQQAQQRAQEQARQQQLQQQQALKTQQQSKPGAAPASKAAPAKPVITTTASPMPNSAHTLQAAPPKPVITTGSTAPKPAATQVLVPQATQPKPVVTAAPAIAKPNQTPSLLHVVPAPPVTTAKPSPAPAPTQSRTAGMTPVTLGNGQHAFVNSQGAFFDASGNPISNQSVSAATKRAPAISSPSAQIAQPKPAPVAAPTASIGSANARAQPNAGGANSSSQHPVVQHSTASSLPHSAPSTNSTPTTSAAPTAHPQIRAIANGSNTVASQPQKQSDSTGHVGAQPIVQQTTANPSPRTSTASVGSAASRVQSSTAAGASRTASTASSAASSNAVPKITSAQQAGSAGKQNVGPATSLFSAQDLTRIQRLPPNQQGVIRTLSPATVSTLKANGHWEQYLSGLESTGMATTVTRTSQPQAPALSTSAPKAPSSNTPVAQSASHSTSGPPSTQELMNYGVAQLAAMPSNQLVNLSPDQRKHLDVYLNAKADAAKYQAEANRSLASRTADELGSFASGVGTGAMAEVNDGKNMVVGGGQYLAQHPKEILPIVGNSISQVAQGMGTATLHPVKTASAVEQSIAQPIKQFAGDLKRGDLNAAGQDAGRQLPGAVATILTDGAFRVADTAMAVQGASRATQLATAGESVVGGVARAATGETVRSADSIGIAARSGQIANPGTSNAASTALVRDSTAIAEKRTENVPSDQLARLEPNNPLSTSIPRNGSRLVLNQGNLPTCGATSCTMLLDTAGKQFDLQKLIVDTRTRYGPRGGTTFEDMNSVLRQNGVDAQIRRTVTIEQLAAATAKGDPAIAAMKLDHGQGTVGHAVVVDGVTVRQGQEVVAIRDPALGRQYFTPIDEFMSKFTGDAIITKR